MTTEEFSNEFDILVTSISDSIKFDEYEKSSFLTKAQESLVLSYYNGKNPSGDCFEKTEEMRRYLSNLIRTKAEHVKVPSLTGLSPTSVFFPIPYDVWFITYETGLFEDDRLGCLNNQEAIVVPITQDDYFRIGENPFRGPSRRRILRLDISENRVEIISDYNIRLYTIRYLKRPDPIILINLPTPLTINDLSEVTECELSSVIHREILELAVKMAIISKIGTQNK